MLKSELPILYTFRRCPFAMRARMGLFEAGQTVRVREVVLRDKPEEMLQASPKATVPVMVLPSGHVLEESIDIILWALDQSDPDQLLPRDKKARKDAMTLINQFDGVNETTKPREGSFKYHLDRYKYSNRHAGADALAERQAALPFLSTLEERLVRAPFLDGDNPSVVDIAIAPFIRQFANTDRDWFDSSPFPNMKKWLAHMLERPAFLETMKKFNQWHSGDEEPLLPVRKI